MKIVNMKREKVVVLPEPEVVFESSKFKAIGKSKFVEFESFDTNIRSIRKIDDLKDLNEAG